jgi:hypothetical protein
MSHEQPTTQDTPTQDTAVRAQHTAVQAPDALAHQPLDEQDDWLEEPAEPELPRRPRRRLLTPVPLSLLGVLLIACGFIAGVLVEKGQDSSSTSASGASGLASRFAALRSGAASGASTGRNATGAGAGAFAGGGAGPGGGASATVGQVAYVSGDTLYVTNTEGNTVKVTTSVASTVTKTVKADVKGIHPGETVIVTGSAGANGAIDAESVRVSEAGGGGGLGAALFGGRGGSSSRRGSARGGGGEPALFGG